MGLFANKRSSVVNHALPHLLADLLARETFHQLKGEVDDGSRSLRCDYVANVSSHPLQFSDTTTFSFL